MRERLGFGTTDPIMAVAASLEPQKGHRVLFEALPAVLKEFPAAPCRLCGRRRASHRTARSSRTPQSPEKRFVCWPPAELEDWFALCDFTILPSFFRRVALGRRGISGTLVARWSQRL